MKQTNNNFKKYLTCEAIPFDGFKEQVRIVNDLKRKFKNAKIEILNNVIFCETIEVVKDI